MSKNANFFVDGRLTQLLGESYASVEHALKELVDNAWDADAENVYISMPTSLDDQERFISIQDDGTGMNEACIVNEYLHIARDRVSLKGDKTELKNRMVKGRKGIGKFAGLLVADLMSVSTTHNGIKTTFEIKKSELISQHDNMSNLSIPLHSEHIDSGKDGTEVRLNEFDILSLNPSNDKLKELLVIEYGREEDFNIFINGERLKVEDVGGKNYKFEQVFENSKKAVLNFNIASKEFRNKKSGIVLRTTGKIIGSPHYWGVDDINYIHDKLLRKVYGEVEADYLSKYTSNSWGIMTSTYDYQELEEFVKDKLLFALNDSFEEYIKYTKKKLENEINNQIDKLPEHKKEKAIKIIDKVLRGLSDGRHSEQQIKNIISVVISAIEKDDYYEVIEKIANADDQEVEMFADVLNEFGLVDISLIVSQSKARLTFLDQLQTLADNPKTLEKEMHVALEKNMWVFGYSYSVMASNATTKHVIEKYLSEKFAGKRANKRPDLLLNSDNSDRFLLIEFKRPSLPIDRTHEAQAAEYRDDLLTKFCNKSIDVLVVGKCVASTISPQQTQPNLKLSSYDEVILNARNELNWLIESLEDK